MNNSPILVRYSDKSDPTFSRQPLNHNDPHLQHLVMADLPSHRQILTALITSLPEIAPSSHEPSSSPPSPSNSPLDSISQNHRHLLLTLHVLFPNLLLPAFDLLDRRLVARLKLCVTTDESGLKPSLEPAGSAERDETMTEGPSDTRHDSPGGLSEIFLVKSLATTLTRRHRDVGLSSQRYLVQLGMWNCSCASFTFDAFPSSGTAATHEHDQVARREAENSLRWSFGGMSLDGLGDSGGDVPCCKHLLACLLVSMWPSMLQSYVEDRQVSKEELVGIIADL